MKDYDPRRASDAGGNEKHDSKTGQFTSGGGSSNGASKPRNKASQPGYSGYVNPQRHEPGANAMHNGKEVKVNYHHPNGKHTIVSRNGRDFAVESSELK